jgi:SAM-dependent methyltransferase
MARMGTGYSSAAGERYAFVLKELQKDIPPPARVVELGAAPGEQSIGLSEAGYEVTAVDIGVASDDWEGAVEGTMEARFAAAGVAFVRWNLEETPYPLDDGAFDAVVMTEVFEHLRDYPAKSLHEVRRILRPGGRLYFTTPNAAYVGNRVRLALGRNVATPLPDWIGGVPHARHAREYTFDEARELMRQAGLEPTLVTSRHLHVHSGRSSPASRAIKTAIGVIARARPTLGPALVIVARRPG